MKKNLLIMFLFSFFSVIFISYTLYSLGIIANSKERYFYNQLAQVSKSSNKYFVLKELTNFKWDRVCIKTSYSPSEEAMFLNFYNQEKKVAVIKTMSTKCIKIFDNKWCGFSSEKECIDEDARFYLSSKKGFEDSKYIFINFF
jgi:hypothetical protein